MDTDENKKKPIIIVRKKNGETKVIMQGKVKKEVSFLIDEKLHAEFEGMCISHGQKKDEAIDAAIQLYVNSQKKRSFIIDEKLYAEFEQVCLVCNQRKDEVVNAAIRLYVDKKKRETEIPKDKEEKSFIIDKELYAEFEQAGLSYEQEKDEAVSNAMRLYVDKKKRENEIPKDKEEVSFIINKELYAEFKQAGLSRWLNKDITVSNAMQLYVDTMQKEAEIPKGKEEVSFVIDKKLYAEFKQASLSHEEEKDKAVSNAMLLYVDKKKRENEIPKDKEEFSFIIDKKLYADFTQASLSQGQKNDEVVSNAMRLYVDKKKRENEIPKDKEEISFIINKELYADFEQAGLSCGLNKDMAVSNAMRLYVDKIKTEGEISKTQEEVSFIIDKKLYAEFKQAGLSRWLNKDITVSNAMRLYVDKKKRENEIPKDKEEKSFIINKELYAKFEEMCVSHGQKEEEYVNAAIRLYINLFNILHAHNETNRTKKSAKKEYAVNSCGMFERKILKWARNPKQCNHKIIRAFFMAEDIVGEGNVTLRQVEALCSDKTRSDLYVPPFTFNVNYSRMKCDESDFYPEGKVFEDDDELVIIRYEVEKILLKYKSMFYEEGECYSDKIYRCIYIDAEADEDE